MFTPHKYNFHPKEIPFPLNKSIFHSAQLKCSIYTNNFHSEQYCTVYSTVYKISATVDPALDLLHRAMELAMKCVSAHADYNKLYLT